MNLREKLYISTIGQDAEAVALKHGLGLEIAEFCTAVNMQSEEQKASVRQKMKSTERIVFHAPFNELCPAAIEPLVVDVTRLRHGQAFALAEELGARKTVYHSGFVPYTYYPQWFTARSVEYWQEFLSDKPEDITVCIENVMEPEPDMLLEIVKAVGDRRLRLCLDVGHAGTCASKVPISEWTAAFAPYLSHVHLHSNEGGMDLHLPLGEGKTDMARVIEDIVKSAPDATFTIECPSGESSVNWLKTNGFLGDLK